MILWFRSGPRPRPLLFEHVPKCGGTAIRTYLERHYARPQIYDVYERRPREREVFRSLPEAQRHAYGLVIGHGIHGLLDWCRPDIVAATVLRKPVERIVSHYYYVRERPEHYLHEAVVGRNLSLGEYAASNLSIELRNNMVCRFLGVEPDEAERDPQRSVDTAWDILRSRYRVVGVVERLSPAMHAIREAVGLGRVWSGERTNRTRNRAPIEGVSVEDRRVIEAHNALDIELYQRVAEVAPA